MVLSKTANGLTSKHEASQDNYISVAEFYNNR